MKVILNSQATHVKVMGRDIIELKPRLVPTESTDVISYPFRWFEPFINDGIRFRYGNDSYGDIPLSADSSFPYGSRICLVESLSPITNYIKISPGGIDVKKNAYNALLLAGWPAFADAIVTLSTNLTGDGQFNDLTYFNADKVHLNDTGQALVAAGVDPTVDAVIASIGSVNFTDGDKGNITVSNAGQTMTIDSGVVTNSMLAGSIDLTTKVTGILPVANGGTGAATLSANAVLLGNGTSVLQAVAPSTSGNVLTSNGTTWQSTVPAVPTLITLANEASDTTCFPLFATATTGDLGPKTSASLTYNSAIGTLTATTVQGSVVAVTGNGIYNSTSVPIRWNGQPFLISNTANRLDVRNGTTAQGLAVFDTYTSDTDYHRLTAATVRISQTATAGATITLTGLIPDGAVVLGVTTKVTTALTGGVTGYQVGTGSDPDRWGVAAAVTVGTTTDNRDWTSGTIECFTSATDILLTANGASFSGTGVIYVSVQYMIGQAD